MRRRPLLRPLFRALLALTLPVTLSMALVAPCRADGDEEAALRLADTTPQQGPQTARPWSLSLEAAALEAEDRAGRWEAQQRLSVDGAAHGALPGIDGWQWTFADRLDLFGPDRLPGQQDAVNTLKDLYVGGPAGDRLALDLGRINTRYGVGYGWNPTDLFRFDAVRAVSSPDPASLRENRLGTVMLRAQHLWQGGALTAIVAPRLADQPDDDGASVDLGATNHSTRWLLAATQKLADDFAPQLMLWRDDDQPGSARLGLNLTRLVGGACVAHLEAAGGRVPSRLAVAQGRADADLDWRGQLVAGGTCTSPWNQSLTLEVQHDGEAVDAAGLRALVAGPPQDLLAYLRESQRGLDPLTRNQLFAQLRWTNAGIAQLDLSGYLAWSLDDQSHSAWLEARYHWPRTDVAVQWQLVTGGPATANGLNPLHRTAQVLVRHWF
jgi:hypothetical protein